MRRWIEFRTPTGEPAFAADVTGISGAGKRDDAGKDPDMSPFGGTYTVVGELHDVSRIFLNGGGAMLVRGTAKQTLAKLYPTAFDSKTGDRIRTES